MAVEAPTRSRRELRAARRQARRVLAEPRREPNSILASAAVLTAGSLRQKHPGNQWQQIAWEFYDSVGPLAYVTQWYESALSRVRIFPVVYDGPGDPVAVESGPAVDILNEFGGGPAGLSKVFADSAPHMFVPGECYYVGRDRVDDAGMPTGGQEWFVASTNELTDLGGVWEYNRGDGVPQMFRADETVVIRVWNPHPRRSWLPDSPVLHVLNDLAEILGYSRRAQADIDSRLASNGLLLLPQEITLAPSGQTDQAPEGVDPVTFEFVEIAKTAMRDRTSPAAVVPIIGRVPGDYVDKVKWLQFWSEFDITMPELRSGALVRLAQGLNIPPEILLGVGDTNHWGAWQIDESAIKMHVEPMILAICESIAVGYYRQALAAAGIANPQLYAIGYDATDLKVRPDVFDSGVELYDRGLLKGERLLAAAGYETGDLGTQDDVDRIARLDAAKNTRPGQGNEPAVPITSPTNQPIPDDDGTTPPDGGPPAQAALDIGQQLKLAAREAAYEASCDGLVMRALEIIGNRLRTGNYGIARGDRVGAEQFAGIPVHQTHTVGDAVQNDRLFANLWTSLPHIAARYDVDSVHMLSELDTYVKALVEQKRPHSLELMSRAVARIR